MLSLALVRFPNTTDCGAREMYRTPIKIVAFFPIGQLIVRTAVSNLEYSEIIALVYNNAKKITKCCRTSNDFNNTFKNMFFFGLFI